MIALLAFGLAACNLPSRETAPASAAGTPAANSSQPTVAMTPTLFPTHAPSFSPTYTEIAPSPTPEPSSTPVPEISSAPEDWLTYSNQSFGFELKYPPQSTLEDMPPDHARIDLPFTPDTNLQEKYLEIDAYTITEGQECSSPFAMGYAPEAIHREAVIVNGIEFNRASGGEGAAGNFYAWTAYSTSREDICVSLTFILHSTNVDNYEVPPPEFDLESETSIFEPIAATFRITE